MMLIFKTHIIFIKNKKIKSSKRIYKKKYFTAVYQNDIHIGAVTKFSKRNKSKIVEPTKPEDYLSYNKELQEFFKANPPIPIVDTKKYEVSEQDGMIKVKLGTMLKGGIRLFNKDDHGNLVKVTKEIYEELQNSYPENINPFSIRPLPFREAGIHKDWLIKKIKDVNNEDSIESDYINIWTQTPSTIKVIDEQIKTK